MIQQESDNVDSFSMADRHQGHLSILILDLGITFQREETINICRFTPNPKHQPTQSEKGRMKTFSQLPFSSFSLFHKPRARSTPHSFPHPSFTHPKSPHLHVPTSPLPHVPTLADTLLSHVSLLALSNSPSHSP